MSMKKFIDTIGNRTRDLLACSAVPQPTAPLRAPYTTCINHIKPNVDASVKKNEEKQFYVLPVKDIIVIFTVGNTIYWITMNWLFIGTNVNRLSHGM
jgi:hypothetical protein